MPGGGRFERGQKDDPDEGPQPVFSLEAGRGYQVDPGLGPIRRQPALYGAAADRHPAGEALAAPGVVADLAGGGPEPERPRPGGLQPLAGQPAGGQGVGGPFAGFELFQAAAFDQPGQQPVGEAPLRQRVEVGGHDVVRYLPRLGDSEAEPGPEEMAGGVLQEADQVVEADHGRGVVAGREEGVAELAGLLGAGAALDGEGPVVLHRVERPGPFGAEAAGAGVEVLLAEGLERVMGDDSVEALGAGHLVQDVSKFGDGGGGRVLRVGELVAPGVGDDEAVAGGHHRVEEELAVLGGPVGVAYELVVEEQVVAVALSPAGEPVVVHPEQAHHPVGHRPHRGQGADGDVTGAEVERAGGVLRPVLHRQPGFGGADLRVGAARRGGARRGGGVLGSVLRRGEAALQQPFQVAPLPLFGPGGGGEEAHGGGDGRAPLREGAGMAEEGAHRLDAVDDLGEQAGRAGLLAFDAAEGGDAAGHPDIAVGVEDSGEGPV